MPYTSKISEGIATLDITIPWEELKDSYEKSIEDATKNAKSDASMKGFRKGHVPEDLAKGQVDRMRVLSQSVDETLQVLVAEAIAKEELKVAGNPTVNVKKMAEGNDVEVEIGLAIIPELELPKEWKKIVTKVNQDHAKELEENPEKATVTDVDLQSELERIAHSRTTTKKVDRAAKNGDEVTIDFDVKQDGVLIENGSSKDYKLMLGKGAFIPGFEEELIGLSAPAEKTFKLAFPEKYHAEHLAGKEAEFVVSLKEVNEQNVPEINDDFAKEMGKDIESLDDLKKKLRDNLQSERDQSVGEGRKTQYLEQLSDADKTTIPAALIEEETGRMMQEMEQQISGSGMTFDDYIAQSGQTREGIAKVWEPQAVKRIKSALLLEKLGEELKIVVDNKEIEEETTKAMAMYGGMQNMEGQIDPKQFYEYTKGMMRNRKVFVALEKM